MGIIGPVLVDSSLEQLGSLGLSLLADVHHLAQLVDQPEIYHGACVVRVELERLATRLECELSETVGALDGKAVLSEPDVAVDVALVNAVSALAQLLCHFVVVDALFKLLHDKANASHDLVQLTVIFVIV